MAYFIVYFVHDKDVVYYSGWGHESIGVLSKIPILQRDHMLQSTHLYRQCLQNCTIPQWAGRNVLSPSLFLAS